MLKLGHQKAVAYRINDEAVSSTASLHLPQRLTDYLRLL